MSLRRRNRRVAVRLAAVLVCTLAAALLLIPKRVRTQAQNHARVPMTTDWSNRHMVYSAPSSMTQAWRLQAEPRYLHQWTWRQAAAWGTQ